MAFNERFPTLMPTLYPVSNATDPRPFASSDAMWKAFSGLAHNETPAVNNGEKYFLYPFLRPERGHSPRRGPRSARHGRGQGRGPSTRFLGRRNRAIIRLLCQLLIPPTPGL